MSKTLSLSMMFMLFFSGIFSTIATAQNTDNADSILGKWINEDHNRVIEFVKYGNTYDAIVTEAPDKSMVGKKQLTELRYSDGVYHGQVHIFKKNKALSCSVVFKNIETIELTAQAGFMSKSQTWTRVK